MTEKEARLLIGERIREARRYRGLTQLVLGKRLYMSQTLISAIEKGKTPISASLVKRVSEELRVSVLYLMGYEARICVIAEKKPLYR